MKAYIKKINQIPTPKERNSLNIFFSSLLSWMTNTTPSLAFKKLIGNVFY